MNSLPSALRRLSQGDSLDYQQAYQATLELTEPTTSEAAIGAFLMGLRLKGETQEEIWGCASALRTMAPAVDLKGRACLDSCGTGGDGSSTLNLSTLASFVAGAAGLCVVKHGNRSITSQCGSADLVEQLGLSLLRQPQEVEAAVAAGRFAFLFAPAFHQATARVSQARRALGFRTLFNLLGPLTNPCRPTFQVIGVPEAGWCRPIAWVAGQLGVERALVVCGQGGVDELVLHGPSQVCWWAQGQVVEEELDPGTLGLKAVPLQALAGAGPQHNAQVSRQILQGEAHPASAAVALNAAALLRVAGRAESWSEALEISQQLLASGSVWKWLEPQVQKGSANSKA